MLFHGGISYPVAEKSSHIPSAQKEYITPLFQLHVLTIIDNRDSKEVTDNAVVQPFMKNEKNIGSLLIILIGCVDTI